jgi:Bacteriophage related domain of unknown function
VGYISTANVQIALDTQLQTVVGLPNFVQENQAYKATNVNPYSRSTLAPAKSTFTTIGINPIMQQTGLYQVDCFYPTAYGFSTGRQMADAIINAFLPGQLLLPDNVNYLTILSAWSLPAVSTPDSGAFWMLPVRVEWIIWAQV